MSKTKKKSVSRETRGIRAKRGSWIGAAGLVLAGATLYFTAGGPPVLASATPPKTSAPPSVCVGGDVTSSGNAPIQIACGSTTLTNHYEATMDKADAGEYSQQLAAAARRYEDTPVTGAGPWPFQVFNTAEIGLKVMDAPTQVGDQVGTLHDLQTVLVRCVQDSGYTPPLANHTDENYAASLWLEIAWMKGVPAGHGDVSDGTATGSAWVYSGYVMPDGHDGLVPVCA